LIEPEMIDSEMIGLDMIERLALQSESYARPYCGQARSSPIKPAAMRCNRALRQLVHTAIPFGAQALLQRRWIDNASFSSVTAIPAIDLVLADAAVRLRR
jgi:hypothetical protein